MTGALTLWLIAWGGALFIIERVLPRRIVARSWERLGTNLALGLMLFLVSPVVQWITLPVASAGQSPMPLLDWFGPIAGLIAQFIILDIWTYGLHRAYHRIPAMWRLHGVHHLDAHLDTTSAIRFHFGEVLLSSVLRLLPLYLFGISVETNAAFGAILVTSALFHHSNIAINPSIERALSWVIVTPSIHWVHHHAKRVDTDANYAAILSIWDRLFGSRSSFERVPDMVVGVEGEREQPLSGLIIWPFRRRN
jgi:sterol desaturase/sphingolipid hydroxylase (fatty acid hydroxylase superfamily)